MLQLLFLLNPSMLNPSIAYGKNKAMSDTIAENNLEQPSSPVTQQSELS